MVGPLHPHQDPQLTTQECEELNVWSAAVGWETDYRQLGKGRFDAWFDISLCEGLRVVDQFCSREMFATGLPPANQVALLVPVNQGDRGVFQGKTLDANEVAVMGPGSAGAYRTPPDLRLITICVPITQLRQAFEMTSDQTLDPLVCQTRIIRLSSERINRFLSIVRQVINAAPGKSFHPAPEMLQRQLESSLLASLVDGLTGGDPRKPRRIAKMNRTRFVMAARDYIDAHLGEALRIETLAHAIDVSPRSLEYAFREVCDLTPNQYIKIRRLHACRQRLLNPNDPAVTVTRVAIDHGLSHLSYFAKDYHALFGEYPSETLAGASPAGSVLGQR